MLWHVMILCAKVRRFVKLHYDVSKWAVLCCAATRYVVLRYVLVWDGMFCYVTLCCVVSCIVCCMLYVVN